MGYSIIINTFNRSKQLRQLLEDIHATLSRHYPDIVYIADDGSTGEYQEENECLAPLYSTSKLPIEYLYLPHQGPVHVLSDILSKVISDHVVIMHDDVRLNVKIPGLHRNLWPIPDPIGAIYGFNKNSDPKARIAIVCPYVLTLDFPRQVFCGYTGIDREKGYWNCYSTQWLFYFEPIRRSALLAWKPIPISHPYFFSLNMAAYRECGGIDLRFAPYWDYVSDLSMSLRKHSWNIRLTHKTVVFHSHFIDKPDNSLTLIKNGDEAYINEKLMHDKWNTEEYAYLLQSSSLYNQVEVQTLHTSQG